MVTNNNDYPRHNRNDNTPWNNPAGKVTPLKKDVEGNDVPQSEPTPQADPATKR